MLSQKQEEDFVQLVFGMEEMLFGVSKLTIQEIALDLAYRNDVSLVHLFISDMKKAGRMWFGKFMVRRHKLVSLRNPEGTSTDSDTTLPTAPEGD